MATIETKTYDKATKTLTIVFGYDTEKKYTYKGVPVKIWSEFEKAESAGKFFHANIRPKFQGIAEYL